MGILPGQPATDVLLTVLKSGSVQEQIAALHYLKDQASEGVILAIYHLLYGGEDELREPALHTLWWMAASRRNRFHQPAVTLKQRSARRVVFRQDQDFDGVGCA